MAETATATKPKAAKKTAAKKTTPSPNANTNKSGDVKVTDPTDPPATTAGINATKEINTLGSDVGISEAQRKAQEQLAAAEALDKVNTQFGTSAEELQKTIDANDKKGVDKDGNLEDPGLTERLQREKLAGLTPGALARENVAYVTDQENIFNVSGLSAPAVPVASKDSGQ